MERLVRGADGDHPIARYTIQVSTSNTFSSLVINKTATMPTFTATANLLPSTIYYWRVNVTGAYGTSNWSAPFSFTTQ